jgi:hypothetical protein
MQTLNKSPGENMQYELILFGIHHNNKENFRVLWNQASSKRCNKKCTTQINAERVPIGAGNF